MNDFFSNIKKWLLIQRYRYWQYKDKEMSSYLSSLNIMTSEETIKYIINNNLSCTRYGDGEFLVMGGKRNQFQKVDLKLAKRLMEIFDNPIPGLLVCIPTFMTDVSPFVLNSQLTGLGFNHALLKDCVIPYVSNHLIYGDSLFTRFYMNKKDKSKTGSYVQLLKRLWDNQDLLIVEGASSRLGVGNDLFDNASSIKRILCPNQNAFDRYDEIFDCIRSHYKGELIILALGMTATILAYDLCKNGMRSLDLGHVDVEYEWFRMGATHKVPISNKQMSEVEDGFCNPSSDNPEYLSEIIAKCC